MPPKLRALARKTNLTAFFLKVSYSKQLRPLAAGILAPIGILLNPAIGAVIMSPSTVIVAVNAQLMKNTKL